MPGANDEQRDNENQNAAEGDLQEGEFLRFNAETEEHGAGVEELLHGKSCDQRARIVEANCR